MIDEKKIEEAAKKYASFIDSNDIKTAMEIGFKAGIDWFLKNLWHPASEEPKEQKVVLLECNTPKGKDTFVRIIPFDWKFSVKKYNITRWLYIDDLMKGGSNG